jgi:SWI/SNF-related matrix-associated actin-dependent regulator 1 of chromatin subfamily A
MRTKLMKFQVRGVRFIEKLNGRALIGDDMGLGKTIQSIAWMVLHPEVRPVLIVCPASIKYNWQRELWVHAHLRSQVLEGSTPYDIRRDIVIINYDILHHWKKVLFKFKPQLFVVDECHYIKTPNIKRTRTCLAFSRRCKHMLALSGTPIINRPIEFFPVLNMLDSEEWRFRMSYAFRYCDPHRGFMGRGWDLSGASHLEELHERVSKIMIRRTKAEVLPELPKKRRTYLRLKTDLSEYRRAEAEFLLWLEETEGKEAALRAQGALALVQLGKLKKLAAQAILPLGIDWISSFLEESDQKLVAFAIHRSILSKLTEAFPRAAVISGEVSSARERQKEAERFQKDPKCRLLLGGLRPAGTGWTLTAASTTVFFEVGWTPGEHDQAEDRVHRIGQKADSVSAYYLVPMGTVVEDTLELIEKKRKIISQAVDGEAFSTHDNTVDQLVRRMRRRQGDGHGDED